MGNDMNRKKIFAVTFIFIFLTILDFNVLAWDNQVTHRDLSEYAAENSVIGKNKGDYLKNFGFNNALDDSLTWGGNTQKIRNWIRDGADFEDAGNYGDMATGRGRSYNHFHNPLKQYPWTDAGLDDWIALPPFHTTGESSIIWAQDSVTQSASVGGDWSWQNVRALYYYALTAQTETDRQMYFANTFDGLGHQMHLIQDASQPDHVRNDITTISNNLNEV